MHILELASRKLNWGFARPYRTLVLIPGYPPKLSTQEIYSVVDFIAQVNFCAS